MKLIKYKMLHLAFRYLLNDTLQKSVCASDAVDNIVGKQACHKGLNPGQGSPHNNTVCSKYYPSLYQVNQLSNYYYIYANRLSTEHKIIAVVIVVSDLTAI